MYSQSNICIVGNGAVGKAAALGFAQAGLSVTLLNQATAGTPESPATPITGAVDIADAGQPGWDVRVYALNQVARNLLTSLRVWDAMDASRIAPVETMVVKGDGGQVAGSLTFDAYGARTDALTWIVEDRNLNQALDAALRFAPNLRIVNGQAARLKLSSENAEVHLASGEILGASLVVGADGANSWVRGQCDIDIDYRSYAQQAIVANFECAQPHHGVAYQWFTSSEGIVALLPLPGNRMSLVWSAPNALAETLLREPLAAMAERLSALPGHQLGQLTPLQPEAVKALPLAFLRPRAIVAPRVALAGDAAHVIHPLAGHGMNLGFADVAALLKAVAEREAHRDCGDERILSRYARTRKEDILLMQIATDGLERLFSIDFEPLRLARNLGLNLVNKLPVIKRTLISRALGKI